jgi:hypothetical protein
MAPSQDSQQEGETLVRDLSFDDSKAIDGVV